MYSLKQEKSLFRFDIAITIIALLGIISFTVLFGLIENETKYMALGILIVCITIFMKSSSSIEKYLKGNK